MKGIRTAILAFACSSIAMAQTMPSNTPAQKGDNADASFIQQAGEGGMAEVELSRLAMQNAASADVKRFASQMVQAHSENNKQLATIAAHENVPLPKALSSEHEAAREKLSALKGSEFDMAYVDAMRSDHQKMDDLLKSSQATVSTEELRTFIKKTEPVVAHHLAMAQNLKVN